MNQLTIAAHNQKIQLWLSRIKDCRASGQSVAQWCDSNDINIKSYYYWMRKIKTEAFELLPAERKARILSSKPISAFAEIPLIKKSISDSCAIRLCVSDLTLEIQNGAYRQTIEDTLQAIQKLC